MFKIWKLNKIRTFLLMAAMFFVVTGLCIQVVHAQSKNPVVTVQNSTSSNFDLLNYRIGKLESFDISERLTRLEDMEHNNNSLLIMSLGGILAMVLESGYRIITNFKK